MVFVATNFDPRHHEIKVLRTFGPKDSSTRKIVVFCRDRQYSQVIFECPKVPNHLIASLDGYYKETPGKAGERIHEAFPDGFQNGSLIPDGLVPRFISYLVDKGYRVRICYIDFRETPLTGSDLDRSRLASRPATSPRYSVIENVLSKERGQYVLGSNEMIESVIQNVCYELCNSRILITCPSATQLKGIYKRLKNAIGSVRMLPREQVDPSLRSRKVYCCTTGTLYHAMYWQWDYVLALGNSALVTNNNIECLRETNTVKFHSFLTKPPLPRSLESLRLESVSGPIRFNQVVPSTRTATTLRGIRVSIRKEDLPRFDSAQTLEQNNNWLRKIAAVTNTTLEKEGQTIIFAGSIQQAYALQHWLTCPVVHDDLPDSLQSTINEMLPSIGPIIPMTNAERASFLKKFESGEEHLAIFSPRIKLLRPQPKLACIIRADAHKGGEHDRNFIQFVKSITDQDSAVKIIDFWHPESRRSETELTRHYQLYRDAGFKLSNRMNEFLNANHQTAIVTA